MVYVVATLNKFGNINVVDVFNNIEDAEKSVVEEKKSRQSMGTNYEYVKMQIFKKEIVQ